jgi:hypothetical protein
MACYDKATPESKQKKVIKNQHVKNNDRIKGSNNKKGVDIHHPFLYFRPPLLQGTHLKQAARKKHKESD